MILSDLFLKLKMIHDYDDGNNDDDDGDNDVDDDDQIADGNK